MFKRPHLTLLFFILLGLSFKSLAQGDIFTQFGGVYLVEQGPKDVQFVLYPKGQELHGKIIYGGRDFALTATVDGLTLKGVFGPERDRRYFRMPLSSTSRYQVSFAEDDWGPWSFLRLPLPSFTGEFSGEFGRLTLQPAGQGLVSGEYATYADQDIMPAQAITQGLEATLQPPLSGKLLYSLSERRYFAQIDNSFSAVAHKTLQTVQQERRIKAIRDNNAWHRALAKRTEAALETYRKDWPDGRHIDEINTVKEQWHWQDVQALGRFENYHAHFRRFPNGINSGQADDKAWDITRAANTDKAYDRYLQAFTGGRYTNAANAGKEALAWHRASLDDTINSYGEYAAAYPQGRHLESADQAAWQVAGRINSITSFNAYKKAFPKGMHTAQVEQAKTNVERILADNKAFKIARARDSQAGYEAYLSNYPGGRHTAKAKAGIKAIVAQAQAQQDDAAWRKALAGQSESAINFYAINWPDGRHIDEVPKALKRLKQVHNNEMDDKAFKLAQNANSFAAYRKYLSQYPDGQHRQRAEKAIKVFEDAILAEQDRISRIQHHLQDMGYLNTPANGMLDSPTKTAILKFQRAMKLTQTGKADDNLAGQLDNLAGFKDNLKRAKAGSTAHMFAVANNFAAGRGTSVDAAKAMTWYKKAAQEGHPKAMARLGRGYITGYGNNKDHKQGLKWLKKSVRFGETEAMYQLGLLYLEGTGVRQNNKKAHGWLMRSANNGNTDAMKYLGDMYALGNGVKKDSKQAAQWYEKAAAGQTLAPQ